jgi:hypothetical protein
MALHKITKKSLKGSMLVQFKYVEREGTWTHASSSNSFLTIDGKQILMTPQFPDSIMETSCQFSIGDSTGAQNHTDTFLTRLMCNGSEEYLQQDMTGLTPYGTAFIHTGGRNDRVSPTRRVGHVTNVRTSVAFTHAYIPRTTNQITFEVQVRCTADRDFQVKDFFMICKEIGIPEDRVKSGSVNTDVP